MNKISKINIIVILVLSVGMFFGVRKLILEEREIKDYIQYGLHNIYVTMAYIYHLLPNMEISSIAGIQQTPEIHIGLSKNDLAHFDTLYGIYERLIFSDDRLRTNDEYYAENNKRRKAILEFEGTKYKIHIKAHGTQPTGHHLGKYFSLDIKMHPGETIRNTSQFKLIIREKMPYQELISDLVKHFNVLAMQEERMKVTINNWDKKLYYFEHPFDDKNMEIRSKSSLHIFGYQPDPNQSKIKSMIFGDVDSSKKYFNEFEALFYKALDENKSKIPRKYFNSIYEPYSKINKALHDEDYKNIINFFDLNYIASFCSVRLIAGLSSHGLESQNLYVFYDFASGKFFPTISHDDLVTNLSLSSDQTPEKQLSFYGNIKYTIATTLARNDLIRQHTYKMIYDFIRQQGQEFVQRQNELYANEKILNYYGPIREAFSDIGLLPEKVAPTIANLAQLKPYLEKSDPTLTVSIQDGRLQLEILPNSMSAIHLKKLIFKHPVHTQPVRKSLAFTMTASIDNKMDERLERKSDVLQDAQGIHLTDIVADLPFSTALDANLLPASRKYTLTFNSDTFTALDQPENHLELVLLNTVTGQEIVPRAVTSLPMPMIRTETESVPLTIEPETSGTDWVRKNSHIKMTRTAQHELIIHPGEYLLTDDLILPSDLKLVIEAGTTLRLGNNVAILGFHGIDVRGTSEHPVIITAADPKKPFGSVGIMGDASVRSTIRHLHLSHGNERWINGIFFSGGLSLHYNGEVNLEDSIISDNHADDGLNIKYSPKIMIKNSTFENNFADQIDLDYCTGTVTHAKFLYRSKPVSQTNTPTYPNGDGLDISGSHVMVRDSHFSGFMDKGISIGEKSEILVIQNILENNAKGAAIKDLSHAYFLDNRYINNQKDVVAYQKKVIFGGGNIYIPSNNAHTTPIQYTIDNKSTVQFFPDGPESNWVARIDKIQNIMEIFEKLKKLKFKGQ